MQATGGQSHWFGDHPNHLRSHWRRWLPLYESVARDAEQMDIEIINATRETALTCFRRMPLDQATDGAWGFTNWRLTDDNRILGV